MVSPLSKSHNILWTRNRGVYVILHQTYILWTRYRAGIGITQVTKRKVGQNSYLVLAYMFMSVCVYITNMEYVANYMEECLPLVLELAKAIVLFPYVAVPSRHFFHCIIQLHYCIQSAVVQNFC